MILKIRYKYIENERTEDAPFMGALISAIDCNFNCKNCFNQSLKEMPTLEKEAKDIINEIKSDPFNAGIILAGLEWSNQCDEAIEIAKIAKENMLYTMLYTGLDFNDKTTKLLLASGVFDYMKCGSYKEDLCEANHIEYGVVLASSNQHIYKNGVDY